MIIVKSFSLTIISLLLFFFVFYFFRATLVACGGSQARGLTGAVATGPHQSHSNARSEPLLQPTPCGFLCSELRGGHRPLCPLLGGLGPYWRGPSLPLVQTLASQGFCPVRLSRLTGNAFTRRGMSEQPLETAGTSQLRTKHSSPCWPAQPGSTTGCP